MEVDVSGSFYFYRQFLRPDKILKYCLYNFWEMLKNKLCVEHTEISAKPENLLCEHETNTEYSERVRKWIHLLTFDEFFDLSFIQSVEQTHMDFSNDELLSEATNKWFSLTETEKQFHRQKDDEDLNILTYKFHQANWNLHLDKTKYQRNKYVEFLADYYNCHNDLSEDEAMTNASEQWQYLIDTSDPAVMQQEQAEVNISAMPIKTNQKLRNYYSIYRICINYAFYIWGPVFQNFFYKYWNFRPEMPASEALRQSIFLWNIMSKEMKARFK